MVKIKRMIRNHHKKRKEHDKIVIDIKRKFSKNYRGKFGGA
jgi:hypothetical protein